ncbi:MAG: ATP-binding protein [Opitutaceae bacterium]|nr:ATP-binding protein [Opitutaceae bacterium]
MSGSHALVDYSGPFAAVAATCVGIAAVWSNPQRPINRLFCSFSIHVSLWLLCTSLAPVASNKLFWVRLSWAVGALFPFHLWLMKETVVRSGEPFLKKLMRGRWWLLVAVLIAGICFTEWFIQTPPAKVADLDALLGEGEEQRHKRSLVFIGCVAGIVGLLITLLVASLREMRKLVGVQRLELQLQLLGGCATGLTVMLIVVLRLIVDVPWLLRLYPIVVLTFYTVTVVAMTTSRVFNARQLLIVGVHRVVLISVVAGFAYGLDVLLADILPAPVVLLFIVGAALGLAALLNERLDRFFEIYPQGKVARQAAFGVAQRERTIEGLATAFRGVLTGWGNADIALILSGNKQSVGSGALQLEGEGPVLRTMREMRWATPERLMRERSTPDRDAVREFLTAQRLGVLVVEEGLALTVLVGVGPGASRRPYTYPQVMQLTELATIIESALERAHFSAKVQHTEQLATVGVLGASLAHEIRNPLVSIKTFVQLLPNHYQDPAFRQKFFRLIGDEVNRIDQLTDQLLDLSAPRAFAALMLDLHPVLLSSLDLVTAKASHRQVELKTDFAASPDRVFTDASAVKQVMLNLCFNAIQAVDACEESRRWVAIATRNVGDRIEMTVSDGGPGIAPEIRPKLFQPFQTTKSSGFGLGLAVCSDILANLHATISVDPAESERGATFRVSFPCQPLSS